MTRQDFLASLQECLEGNIPRSEIEENMRFYREYFDESKKSEAEVCAELGDPHLIARTLIDSFKASKGPMADYYTEQARDEYREENQNEDYYSTSEQETGWFGRIGRILVLAAFIIVVVALCIFAVGIVIHVVIPVVIVVLIIKFLLDLFRKY